MTLALDVSYARAWPVPGESEPIHKKELVMKLSTAMKLAVIGGIFLTAPAFAQTSFYLKVDVPFAFHVGAQSLPAGEYTMKANLGSELLLISNTSSTASAFVLASQNGGTFSGPGEAQLTFRVYGTTRYLDGVRVPGMNTRNILVSPAEREFAAGQKPETMALVVKGWRH